MGRLFNRADRGAEWPDRATLQRLLDIQTAEVARLQLALVARVVGDAQ